MRFWMLKVYIYRKHSISEIYSVLIQKYRSELIYKSGGALPPYSKSIGAIAPPCPPAIIVMGLVF